MSGCCPSRCAAGPFFSRFARRYRKHYRRHGFDRSQQQLLEGLRAAGFAEATVLEVGSGIGYLHQHLLTQGARRAVGVDLSAGLLDEARGAAREQGLTERVDYREGDFVALADQIAPAEMTVLDRSICCYPDAESLVKASLAKTGRVYAFTIPRDRAWIRLGVEAMALALRLVRSSFRSYVHDPKLIEQWVTARGFHKRYDNETALWLTQVYVSHA